MVFMDSQFDSSDFKSVFEFVCINFYFWTISVEKKPFALSCNWIEPDEIFDISSDDGGDHDEDEVYEIYEIYSEGENPVEEDGHVNADFNGTAQQMQVVSEIGTDCTGETQQNLNAAQIGDGFSQSESKPVLANLIMEEILPFSVDKSSTFEADTTSRREWFRIFSFHFQFIDS